MMNNKLYKKLVIAMMITTISTVAVASADDTTASVRPVDLSQADEVQARLKRKIRKSKPSRHSRKRLLSRSESACQSQCPDSGYYAGNA